MTDWGKLYARSAAVRDAIETVDIAEGHNNEADLRGVVSLFQSKATVMSETKTDKAHTDRRATNHVMYDRNLVLTYLNFDKKVEAAAGRTEVVGRGQGIIMI